MYIVAINSCISIIPIGAYVSTDYHIDNNSSLGEKQDIIGQNQMEKIMTCWWLAFLVVDITTNSKITVSSLHL